MPKTTNILLYACLYLLLAGCVTSVDESLPYAELPEITVATEVTLVASPSHPTAYLTSDAIASGEKVQVIGMDKDAAWLLVLHNMLGWMPTIHSGSNVGNLKPAIEIDPLSDKCTKYLGTTNAPDEVWVSNMNGSAIIQGSIYRPQAGESFQAASLALEITGGGTVVTGDYVHTPLTRSSAIILFTYAVDNLTQTSRIAFDLANPGSETRSFQVAFFSNDCPDELNGVESGFTDQLPVGEPRTVVINSPPGKEADAPQPSQSPSILVSSGEPRSMPISSPVESLAWSPGGQFLAAGSLDGVVGIWRIEDGALLHTLEGHSAAIATLEWSPNGEFLASGSKDGTVRIWQIEDGRSLYTLKSPQSSKLTSQNVALGKSATGSSTWSEHSPFLAIDENDDTLWNSGQFPPAWLEIDLQGVFLVSSVKLVVSQKPDGETRHELLIADDSGIFRKIHTFNGWTQDKQELTYSLDPPQLVKKLKIITISSPSWVGWKEVRVVGDPQ